jgi:putative nucleotidyltransferase with HDIG domain
MDYIPVRLSTLRGDQKIGFDVYVPIGPKNVLYLRKGDSFEGLRLTRLKEKKVNKMLILKSDEPAYREYVNRNIETAYSQNSKHSVEDRATIAHGLQQNTAENLLDNPTDVVAYHEAKTGSGMFVEFLLREEKAIKAMLAVENTDKDLAHHGVAVATYSVTIAKAVGETNPTHLIYLSLGALLHDIGHSKGKLDSTHPLSTYSKDDLAEFHKHAEVGANLVKDLAHVDNQVAQIILQHEERIDGSGFPRGLVRKDLNPLAVIVGTANALDRMIAFEKMAPAVAAKALLQEQIGRHPLEHIKALQAVIHKT